MDTPFVALLTLAAFLVSMCFGLQIHREASRRRVHELLILKASFEAHCDAMRDLLDSPDVPDALLQAVFAASGSLSKDGKEAMKTFRQDWAAELEPLWANHPVAAARVERAISTALMLAKQKEIAQWPPRRNRRMTEIAAA